MIGFQFGIESAAAGPQPLHGPHRIGNVTRQPAAASPRHDSLAYFAAIKASVVSSMRLEKPHSLSYQLSTLTIVPCMTRVWVLS